MSIKEKGYTHWEGELQQNRLPWKPISRYGIKLTFKKKFFKFLFFSALIPAIVNLAMIYISERLEDFAFITRDADAISFLEVNPLFFQRYFNSGWLLFMIIMILVVCGAGLIADDLRFNALQLYFSRPIRKKDYLLGKASVVIFFLFMITLVPGIIFILMKLLFAGNLKFLATYPLLPFSVLAHSVFLTGFFTFYVLLLSSLNKNRRYVAVLIFGLYAFSDILFNIFNGIFRNQYFSLLSIRSNIQQVGAVLFGQSPEYDIPWILSLLVIIGLCGLSAYVLHKKVRGVEIIK